MMKANRDIINAFVSAVVATAVYAGLEYWYGDGDVLEIAIFGITFGVAFYFLRRYFERKSDQ